MKNLTHLTSLLLRTSLLCCLFYLSPMTGYTQYETFEFTGAEQTYTVNADATLRFTVLGGSGGSSNSSSGGGGGKGALISANFAVQTGDELFMIVGGRGLNYSNNFNIRGAGGGGGSAVILNRNGVKELLIVAGAGAGGGFNNNGGSAVIEDGTPDAGSSSDGGGGGGFNNNASGGRGGKAGTLEGGGNGGNGPSDQGSGGRGAFGFGGGGGGGFSAGGGGGGYGGGDDRRGGSSFVAPSGTNVARSLASSSTDGLIRMALIYNYPDNIAYVDPTSTDGNNTGTSWDNAFFTLQDALLANGANTFTQIWVAKGTYYPDEGIGQTDNDRSSIFVMDDGIQVLGGFAGNEGPSYDLSLRDFDANETVLSGDIDQISGFQNNSTGVIYIGTSSEGEEVILEGFTVTLGNSNNSSTNNDGGGLTIKGNATISQCRFIENRASSSGGAIRNDFGIVKIKKCFFEDNRSNFGGALYNGDDLIVSNCIFVNNTATNDGGAIYHADDEIILNNCSIIGNKANREGGAIFSRIEIIINNCTIEGNKANSGGGLFFEVFTNGYSPDKTLRNSIIWNNQDCCNTGTAFANVRNITDLQATYSIIQGYNRNGTGNIDGTNPDNNPLFIQESVFNENGSISPGDVRLQVCSPVINQGNNDANTETEDVAGNDRIFDADNGGIIELGAYEFQPDSQAPTIGDKQNRTANTSDDQSGNCTVSLSITHPTLSDNLGIDVCPPTFTYELTGATTKTVTDLSTYDGSVSENIAFNAGQTTVTYRATDAADNAATPQSYIVTVADDEAPTFSKPSNRNADLDANCEITIPNLVALVNNKADNCGTANMSQTPTANSKVALAHDGTTMVTLKADDGNGNITEKMVTITAKDNSSPEANCKNTINIQLDANGMASITTAQIDMNSTDNCSITEYDLSKTTFSCEDLGPNMVTLEISDGINEVSTCQTTVNVLDDNNPCCAAPVASCKPFTAFVGTNGQVMISVADVNDNSSANCGLQDIEIDNEMFDCDDIGTTQSVQLTITDDNNVSNHCTAQVTIKDNTSPTATCRTNISRAQDEGQPYRTLTTNDANQLSPSDAADNCGAAPTVTFSYIDDNNATITGTAPVDLMGKKIYQETEISFTIADNANPANQNIACQVTITLNDNQAPVINNTQNRTKNTSDDGTGDCTYTPTNNEFDATATDNSGAPELTFTINDGATDVTTDLTTLDAYAFESGQTYTITAKASDATNETMTTYTVIISDNENPTITCPTASEVNTDNNECGAIVNFEAPSGTDNCLGANTTLMSDLGAGDFFPLGETIVTYKVTDAAVLTDECSFMVTVLDNQTPSISCPTVPAVNTDNNECGAIVNFEAPTGIDNCLGANTVLMSDLGEGDFFPLGETIVTYKVTDAADLTDECSFMVTVLDNQSPVLMDCPVDQFISMNEQSCEVTLPNYRAFVTLNDNCINDAQFNFIQTPAPQDILMTAGKHEVILSATDPGDNNATCTFDLNICPPSSLTITNVEMNEVAGGDYSSINEQLTDCVNTAYSISNIQVLGNLGERNAFTDLSFDLGDGETLECIVVASETGGALAVSWLNFEAKATPRHTVDLAWQVHTDENVDFYSIERSADGIHFENIDKVYVTNYNINITRFKYEDKNPFRGDNYYRILQHQVDGSVKGSPTRWITLESEDIALFPNPTNNHFQIILPEANKKPLPFQVFSMDGRLLHQGQLAAEQQRFEYAATDLNMNSTGIYFIKIKMPIGKVDVLKLSVTR